MDRQTYLSNKNFPLQLTFKARKVEKLQEEDHLAIFKPGLWQTGFFGCSKE